MTPREAATELERRANALEKSRDKIRAELGRRGVELAQESSKGTYSLAQLAAMGHPYSRRDPRPPLPAGIINYQSGDLFNSWRFRLNPNGVTIFNVSPEARYIDPKQQTDSNASIGRPIVDIIANAMQKEFSAIIEKYVKEALKI